jgi:hypothetical protein
VRPLQRLVKHVAVNPDPPSLHGRQSSNPGASRRPSGGRE